MRVMALRKQVARANVQEESAHQGDHDAEKARKIPFSWLRVHYVQEDPFIEIVKFGMRGIEREYIFHWKI